MEFNIESIAGLIYDKLKFEKVCKDDLEYALKAFMISEEYEKCAIIKELLELKYYDNRKKSNNKSILDVQGLLDSISSGGFFTDKKDFIKKRERVIKLKEDIENFYNKYISSGVYDIIIPPFKNKNNIKNFLEL